MLISNLYYLNSRLFERFAWSHLVWIIKVVLYLDMIVGVGRTCYGKGGGLLFPRALYEMLCCSVDWENFAIEIILLLEVNHKI